MTLTEERSSIAAEIQTAVRHSAVYGIGGIIAKAIGFVMLPFYTHYLATADYGVLELLDLSMSLCGMFLNMGMAAALLRYYGASQSADDRHRTVSTAFVFTLVTGALTFSVAMWLAKSLSAVIFGPGVPAKYLLLSFASLTLGYIGNIPRTYVRALEASRAFVLIENSSTFMMLALNVYFVGVLHIGLSGILWSSVLVNGLQVLLLSGWLLRRVGLHFNRRILRPMVAFGAPLILSNVAAFTLNFSDRFFLRSFMSLDVVGIYAVGYKFAYMLSYLLMQPFCAMWEPRRYVIYNQPNHRAIFGQVFALYGFLLILTWFALAMFSPEMVRLTIDPKFAAGQKVIPIAAFGYVLWALGYHSQLGMLLTNNTQAVAIISGAAVLVNLGLNYLLIRKFGMLGAAWATLFSFAAIALASYWLSQRALPLPLGGLRVMAGAATAVIFYRVSLLAPEGRWAVTMSVKLLLLAVLPAVLWKTGLISAGERATLVEVKRAALDRVSAFLMAVRRRAAV